MPERTAMSLPTLPELLEIFQRHPYLHRFAILVSYIALMKMADLFIDRVLRRVAARTSMTMDDELLDFLHGPICWTIFWLESPTPSWSGNLSNPGRQYCHP